MLAAEGSRWNSRYYVMLIRSSDVATCAEIFLELLHKAIKN
jgi:hypothetical protein